MAFNHDRECISHNIKKTTTLRKEKDKSIPFRLSFSPTAYIAHTRLDKTKKQETESRKRVLLVTKRKKKAYAVLGVDISSLEEQQGDHTFMADV